jgi:hypothetical protein
MCLILTGCRKLANQRIVPAATYNITASLQKELLGQLKALPILKLAISQGKNSPKFFKLPFLHFMQILCLNFQLTVIYYRFMHYTYL